MGLGSEEIALLTRAVESLERIEGVLMSKPVSKPQRKAGRAYVAARNFIRVQLLEGPKPWNEVLAAGREYGHSKGTLERARPEVAEKTYNQGRWAWRLKEV